MIEILDERYMGDEVAPVILGEEHSLVKTTPIAIHHQDVLEYIPPYDEYSLVANIPYYITSPILFHFLYPAFEPANPLMNKPPKEMVIMMQEEVGEKILE
jgi:16S rRNA A1518/A1519 N6-dimethyltransferase RsmA/KsgA/DIM1 with predicted DNA glycosylase/AP lyase activity